MSRRSAEAEFWLWASLIILIWIGLQWGPLLTCPGGCSVDTEALHGRAIGSLEAVDIRLNSWILAWTQNALLAPGSGFFDANALYPARGALAGSEHLIGPALLTLPVRLFSDNAVLNYNLALLLSSFILGLSTAALTRWATTSRTIAIGAAVIALAMPWRTAEISHLQLLSAGFFPLILLFTMRLMMREAGLWTSLGLFLALTLQLLSSYYLAYQITLCLVIVGGLALFLARPDARALSKVVPAVGFSYLILALVSIPYLSSATRGQLHVTFDPEQVISGDHLGHAIEMLWPRFDTLWQRNTGFEPAFFIPASVLVLALASLPWAVAAARRSPSDDATRTTRARMVTLSLWTCCLAAFFMLPGAYLNLGEESYRLPSYWAAHFVPGFANLRAPHRWAIVMGTALPVLAALGASWLMRQCGERRIRQRLPLSAIVLALAAMSLALNLPYGRLPVIPGWDGTTRHMGLYRALDSLPPGPVLEIPWHLDSLARNPADTRYMLSSTQHRRPLLNGFTAHLPPSYFLLNRISQNLPETGAIDRISQLTDLRWIVVHWEDLSKADRQAWRASDLSDLTRVYQDQDGVIFELAPVAQTGQWMKDLLHSEPRPRTLTGLSRGRLDEGQVRGSIVSVDVGGPLRYLGTHAIPRRLRVRISNQNLQSWPGLDVQTEGLVALRYDFTDSRGQVVEQGFLPLDTDVIHGESIVTPVIRGPTSSGRFDLCLDLVQLNAGKASELAIDPIEIEVSVSGIGSQADTALDRWAKVKNELRRHAAASPERSRCAREGRLP